MSSNQSKPNKLKLATRRLYLEALETSSSQSEAAEKLGISKQAMSLYIKRNGLEATEVGAKPTVGRTKDLSRASQEDNNFEQELDDLIMRLKDCISHEHTNQFGDRCITKVQFKQEMKALYQSSLEEAVRLARIDEHKKLAEVTGLSLGMSKSKAITAASFMLNVNDFQKYRLAELEASLTQKGGSDNA